MEERQEITIHILYNNQLVFIAELRTAMKKLRLVTAIAIMAAAMTIANTLFIINVTFKGF